jgi:hypothetical protein
MCYCLKLRRETPAGVALGVTDWKVVESSFRKTHPRASLARGGASQGQGEWSTGHARERSALARRDDHHHLRPLAAAAREACSKRHVSMTISLAFLAPSLVKAAVDGRLPRGIGVARLFDAPVAWSRQQQMLGFA